MESNELPEQLAHGDVRAFEQLFEAHAEALRRYVYRYVRSRAVAEELTHDVFLRLWARRGQLPPETDLAKYLFGIAHNHAVTYLRRQAVEARHRQRHTDSTMGESSALVVPECDSDELATEEVVAAVRHAVDTLPARQRDVVLLRWQEQLTYDEIGRRLGIAPNTAMTHMSRAIVTLREALAAMRYEFKADLNADLAAIGPELPAGSLAHLIDFSSTRCPTSGRRSSSKPRRKGR